MTIEQKAGSNLMASTWTTAAKVRRAFNAGPKRKKDLLLTPTRAILEGCLVLNSVQDAMREAGLSEDDVKVGLILESEEAVFATLVPAISGIAGTLEKVMSLGSGWNPLGLVFCQVDREADKTATWIQAWRVDPASVKRLIATATAVSKGDYGRQTVN